MLRSLIIALFVLTSVPVIACTCAKDPKVSKKEEITEKYKRADVVFSGNLIKKEVLNKARKRSSGDPVRYTFEIIKQYKGSFSKSTIEILSEASGSSCGYVFSEGLTYLMYTRASSHFNDRFPQLVDDKNAHTTSLCSGNMLRKKVDKKQLRILKRLKAKG
ncbi:hypothetical protein [Dokdonia sp. Asnod2-E02]|uniref:hypothetical protein n=1 Tax=Dokdonia sp. Asnod2-E02 TaxID=3160574 RepID=UPI00386BBAF3